MRPQCCRHKPRLITLMAAHAVRHPRSPPSLATAFSEDRRKQAVVCSKKSLNGSPSEFVSNPSYSEVYMAQATSLQPGQIRHLFWSVVNN